MTDVATMLGRLNAVSEAEASGATVTYPTVHRAVAAVVGAMPAIGKNQQNREQGYAFRGVEDIAAAAKPLLAAAGVVIVPDVEERLYDQRTTRHGTVMHTVNLHVRYRIYGPGGDCIEASAWGEGTDAGDKATNKAMTGAWKFMLSQLLVVADSASDSDHNTPDETVRTPMASQAAVRALVERIKERPESDRDAIKAKMYDAGLSFTEALTQAELDTVEGWAAELENSAGGEGVRGSALDTPGGDSSGSRPAEAEEGRSPSASSSAGSSGGDDQGSDKPQRDDGSDKSKSPTSAVPAGSSSKAYTAEKPLADARKALGGKS